MHSFFCARYLMRVAKTERWMQLIQNMRRMWWTMLGDSFSWRKLRGIPNIPSANLGQVCQQQLSCINSHWPHLNLWPLCIVLYFTVQDGRFQNSFLPILFFINSQSGAVKWLLYHCYLLLFLALALKYLPGPNCRHLYNDLRKGRSWGIWASWTKWQVIENSDQIWSEFVG